LSCEEYDMGKVARIARAASAAVGVAAASYPLYRNRCLTWGATPDEVAMNLPGDELLPDADLVTTRAIGISAPPASIWPWLVQMGSGRGGVYTYDWIENLLGLGMHSADVILPEFQGTKLGDEFPLGPGRGTMRVEVLDPERVLAVRFEDGNWVWIFALVPADATEAANGASPPTGLTRLISRNRINVPAKTSAARWLYSLFMEPGSLVMERKMLLGIKERAERLASRPEPAEVSG
jgi:hypothetical protein